MPSEKSYSFSNLKVILNKSGHNVMKRCFMTGKQCIFSSQIQDVLAANNFSSGSADAQETSPKRDSADFAVQPSSRIENANESTDEGYGLDSDMGSLDLDMSKKRLFIIMPYSPNLKAFYEWNLKPFLLNNCGFKIENIQRADEVREIGYIICEKICRKIQESDLVLADISMSNPNVFYEIGLAIGLERPVIFMRNEKLQENIFANHCIKSIIGFIEDDKIFSYPGVKSLNQAEYQDKLDRCIFNPSQLDQPDKSNPSSIRERRQKISVLSFNQKNGALREEANLHKEGEGNEIKRDIKLDFKDLFSGAVTVAMNEIKREVNSKESLEPWEDAVKKFDEKAWTSFSEVKPIEVDCTGISSNESFMQIAGKIKSSFCTLIDVTGNNPAACFWLGYSHAHGINVIPVNQVDLNKRNQERELKLAFDIRSLWYAEYEVGKPYEFKANIREILEHLLERDLSDINRQTFWDRFPPGALKVFTGAIHSGDHDREVVGDWDVRAVSELFSYLPTVREAATIRLEAPVYSPDEISKNMQGNPGDDVQFVEITRREKDKFIRELKRKLSNTNAIVIASPDVNPLTEYLLYELYKPVKADSDRPCEPFTDDSDSKFNGYIAVKRREAKKFKFPRLFYKELIQEKDKEPDRGFIYHHRVAENSKLFESYMNHRDPSWESFSLLGHLVVARNPLDKTKLIIILNGVSGPATFALAQILIGGGLRARTNTRTMSEKLLGKINDKLDEVLADSRGIGMEAIIKVTVSNSKSARNTYADSREVTDFDFLKSYGPQEITLA